MNAPIFIVGMNGSGTTMLLDSLGRHPQLYGFTRETRLIPDLLERDWGDLNDDENFRKLWDTVRNIPAFGAMNNDQPSPLPENWRSFERTPVAVIHETINHFAHAAQKTCWMEKTPQHAQHVALLAKAWPEARFIHMIRDGRDCAASFNRRWKRTPELTVYRWKRVIRLCRRDGQALGENRYLEIKYEDLTANPQYWMRQACDFLKVDFDNAVLESEQPQSDREGEIGTIVPTKPRWHSAFTASRLNRFENIAGSLLSELGYPVTNPEHDQDPTRLQLKWWVAKDYLRQYTNEIVTKVRGNNRKSWQTILRLPMTAISQARQQRF